MIIWTIGIKGSFVGMRSWFLILRKLFEIDEIDKKLKSHNILFPIIEIYLNYLFIGFKSFEIWRKLFEIFEFIKKFLAINNKSP